MNHYTESPKIAHSKPVDKVAHSLVDTLPPTAIISTYQTNQIMNSETATDLILFLQDMSSDNDNQAPDLELATDYLESQGVDVTPAVINHAAFLIDINF